MAIITDTDRKRMGTMHPDMSAVGPIPAEVKESDHQVPTRDGQWIRVRVYVPTKQASAPRPLIVMYHEGGWRMGDLTDEDLNCRMFARDLGAVCVNVEYRLAPEHPFPTGVDDAYDTLLWSTKTASPTSVILPADLEAGFVVGGSSAGGNFAAVMSQRAGDEGLNPPLTGQHLSVPALLSRPAIPENWKDVCGSRAESKFDPVLKMKDRDEDHEKIEHLNVEPENPMYSPLLHENIGNLPPAFFQIAGLDPLRDEGLLYEDELRKKGVPTRLNVYDGFGHMFWSNWPTLRQSQDFVSDTLAGMKWLLKTNVQPS
ncbi:hypothetical protein AC579_8069 [Pseudocercospora musae]|uniref:Alpha/beta hydrolase fold-3 domain-containing protein n=1 Tax=Pseudocercospora musae TaxID=113226 RepID=A0A139H5C7_9PEZI|nr:hypothetical protein AC579_8069 [Pseudocercospora musae]